MTTTPETTTAQESGSQVQSPETQTVQQEVTTEQPNNAAPSTQQGTLAEESQSYFDSEESLSKRINELTSIADTGSSDEVAGAMNELSKIEDFLNKEKEKPKQSQSVVDNQQQPPTQGNQQSQEQVKPKEGGSDTEDKGKKFTISWDGKRIEYNDKNSLLGFNSTGELKSAYLKTKLQHDEEVKSLSDRLRDAEEKLRNTQKPDQPPPVQPQQQQIPQQQFQQQPSTTAPQQVTRPVPPKPPRLSTTDPAMYTEEDLSAINDYQKATSEFNQNMVDYVASLESRQPQIDPSIQKKLDEIEQRQQKADELYNSVKSEKQQLAEEKAENAHWKRFTDFQDKHESFKMPLPPKQMTDAMNKWMDSVAVANGIQVPVQKDRNYMVQRASVVGRYMDGEEAVLQNTQGLPPPEGHETYFKLLELSNDLARYKTSGVLGENATLEDAYMRKMVESGDFDKNLEVIRTNERSQAAEQFANGVQELQQHAVNIDPSQSAGGPDLNELGFSPQDMQWFSSIRPETLLGMKQKNGDDYKKYVAMADKIEKTYAR